MAVAEITNIVIEKGTELAGPFDSYVKYIIYNNAEDIQNINITMSGSGSIRIMQSGYFTFT